MMAMPLRTTFSSSSSTEAPAFRLSVIADSSAFNAATQAAAWGADAGVAESVPQDDAMAIATTTVLSVMG